MRVSTRLVVGFGLLLLLMAGLVASNVSALSDLLDSSRRLTRVSTALRLEGSQLQAHLQGMDEFARKFAATGDAAYARRFGDYVDAFDASLGELEAMAPEIGGAVPRQVARIRALWSDFSPMAEGFRGRAPSSPAAVAGAAVPVVRWVDAIRTQTLVTGDELRRVMAASVEASTERTRRAERVSWLTAGVALLLALALSVSLVRSIGGGLERLSEGTRRVAGGDLEHRLDTGGAPEFSRLAASFNEMTRRLQEADRMKRDFFAHVSHDLKGPLSGMLDAHDLLLEETAGPLEEDQARLLRLSRESGRRLRRMIDLLLDLARLDAGVAELEMEEIDLAELARRALREHEPRLRRAEVAWDLEVPEGAATVAGDRSYLRRALDNLLVNALDHSPEGGRIGVTVRRVDTPGAEGDRAGREDPGEGPGRWVELAVTDEGPGVDEALRDRIFDRFVRADGRAASGTDGLGLGLALCREVAEAHGGAVSVGESPEGGSRFILSLPGRIGS